MKPSFNVPKRAGVGAPPDFEPKAATAPFVLYKK